MNYKLSENINKEAVFLVKRSELEGRLEPEYYTPELRELESKVREKASKKLRDYIINIAGGATPSTTKQDKYYTDEENGFPFLRVQNLQTNGEINLDNLKFINEKTHEGMLKRSQVEEGDLLVKITGVGRMAITSVAPEGFKGNTNQHMVVIKTGSRKISEYLARYLNLDLVEKLATRRATGATRPALDYSTLKSIPIIEGIDFSILEKAQETKKKKEAEAEKLLKSVDDYLLAELGIEVPRKDYSINNRIFKTNFLNVLKGRLDPYYSMPHFQATIDNIIKSKYEHDLLKKIIIDLQSGSRPKGGVSNIESGVLSIGGEHVGKKCNVGIGKPKYIPKAFHEKNKKTETKLHDIILVKDGATTGKVGIIEKETLINQNINEHVFLIRVDQNLINPHYLTYFLASDIGQIQLNREITGATVTGLTKDAVKSIRIPVPPIEKQSMIAEHISSLHVEADKMIQNAIEGFENARIEIEELMLK